MLVFHHVNRTAVFVSSLLVLAMALEKARAEVGYNRDVLPILANKCFACHGVDAAARKAERERMLPDAKKTKKARRQKE